MAFRHERFVPATLTILAALFLATELLVVLVHAL
mgnify:CR=1 FL=1